MSAATLFPVAELVGGQLELDVDTPPARRLVVVVPCSAAKRPGILDDDGNAITAGDRYVGAFHRYARRHAARLGADVLILSALHGLVPLDRPVADYDVTIAGEWSVANARGGRIKLRAQARQHGLTDPTTVVVSFCPTRYTELLLEAIPNALTPLAGARGIGEQRGRIARITREDLLP